MDAAYLGTTAYRACWELQERLFRLRLEGKIPDVLLLTEHDHVYTIGRSGTDNHLLATDEELNARGVEVFHNDRGGDITYHGPGQLVGYPILDLHTYYLDLHRYLRDIEEAVIRLLATYGITGGRLEGYTGVWVDGEKICAIGIKTKNWVTMHGFALNIHPDLSYFQRIIPCGIFDKGVTSMARILGRTPEEHEVRLRLLDAWRDVFGADVTERAAEEIRRWPAGTDSSDHPGPFLVGQERGGS